MSAKLWQAATVNAFSTTLNGSIDATDDSLTLTTVTGLVAPGVLVIDRQDGNSNNTPTLREYISFTGISGSAITGVTRGLGGSTGQGHSSGALIEETFTITHWKDLLSIFAASHDAAGHIVATSTATIPTARIYTHLNASGASVTGNFPIHPGWVVGGLVSLATTGVGKPLPLPQGGMLRFFSAVLAQPVSGASFILDINRNGTTIFTDQGTRLYIPGGGTYVSTASISVVNLVAGDILSLDIDAGGGLARDLTVLGRIE